ncbi:MAG: TonB-dependent receptor, partial [Bryobacteraceae bacterium]
MRHYSPFLAVVALSLASSPALFAQTAQITGRVTDPTGGVVPGAAIAVTDVETNLPRAVSSNANGYYTVPQLAPGHYRIHVEKTGFKTIDRTGLDLQVDQVSRIDFKLEIGGLQQTVTVSSQGPVLDQETSSLGQVVQSKQVLELPLLGRNPYALGALVPGVRMATGMNNLPVDQITTSSASINGQRGNMNEYLLDGAPNTAAASNQPIIYANVDSVQEFKVQTNSYSAEYGRAAGGVFNVVTKSGTNDAHFTAYEFFRNDALNANDYFANRAGQPPPPFKFNQFGGTLGAPLVLPKLYDGHNKTFFFLSTELVRFTQGVTFSGTIPNPAQLAGDFSNARNAAGKLITIYDPLTTQPNPAGGGFLRSPFPGNVVPASRINAVARNISKYWPSPNAAGALYTGTNNYVRTAGDNIQKNTFSVRVDHNFTDNTKLFTRYSYDDTPDGRSAAYGVADAGSPTPGVQDFTRYNAVSELDHIFSPALIGMLRGSFSRLSNFRNPSSNGFDIGALGFPAGLAAEIGAPRSFPSITVTGFSVSGSIPNDAVGGSLGNTGLIAFGMNNYALQGSLTRTFSTHTLKVGGEARVIRFNTAQTGDSATTFGFNNAFTQGPNPAQASATSGIALATFLLGIAGGSVTPSPYLAMQTVYWAGYLQDDWKLTNRLTLNLGLRYDVELPRTDRFNQFTNFNYGAVPPLTAPELSLHGALSFVGVNGVSRGQYNPDLNNFAPRVGFAWSVTPKTVVRAGGGLFYAPMTGIGGAPASFGISGFDTTTSIVTSLDGFTPITYLNNPYPNGLNQATGSKL